MTFDTKVSAIPTKEKKLNFLRQLQQELYKVNWTTKEELLVCTKIVLGATFTLAIGIYIAEIVIRAVLGSIGYIVRLIGG
ncbi:MAG: preprotein translocase subunit SecE [Chlamydiae bacterium]|nr:preprotein translocase subunit SecE [Chlamydiota bacterium]